MDPSITYYEFDARHQYTDTKLIFVHAIYRDDSQPSVVGQVSLEDNYGYAWVANFYVDEIWRRMGIGRALIERIVEVRDKYYPQLTLGAGVHKENTPSISLFKSLGWSIGEEYRPDIVLVSR